MTHFVENNITKTNKALQPNYSIKKIRLNPFGNN